MTFIAIITLPEIAEYKNRLTHYIQTSFRVKRFISSLKQNFDNFILLNYIRKKIIQEMLHQF